MPFEILDPIYATLSSVTNRTEKHGDDSVPAVSLGLTIETANTFLDRMSPTLRTTLYTRPEGQEDLPGVEPSTPLLRTRGIDSLSLNGSLEGWTLKIDHGIDEDSAITFGGSKVDKFKVQPKEGGSIIFSFRVGTSDVDAERLGLLGMKLGQDISLTLHAPEAKPPAIDGTVGHPALAKQGDLMDDDEPDATDAFVAANA